MNPKTAEVTIGAFLHDIGKISERARLPLSEQSVGMKPIICRTNPDGNYGYLHVAYTNEFFESMKTWLPRELDASKIANIASYHHSPSDVLHYIVQQADWLSAGQDRSEDEGPSRGRDYSKSIFGRMIQRPDGTQKNPNTFLPLVPLALDPSIFPQAIPDRKESPADYNELWKQMFEHFKDPCHANPDIFLEQLAWGFGLYAWCIPSHRVKHLEIPLLDHSLTTAAFAAALYRYHEDAGNMTEQAIKDRSLHKFRLVNGDLSGIQSYLYDTTLENPSGVGKRLRAKSFYLGFLTRLAGSLILDNLGLPSLNRIIDAGGNFTLLIHNTSESLKILQETERQIQEWFHKTFHGKLDLILCYDNELSGEDFSTTRFSKIQEELMWKTDRAKKRPLYSLFISEGKWNTDEFILQPDPTSMTELSSEGERTSPEDEFFDQLGRKLTNGDFLQIGTQPFNRAFENKAATTPLTNPFGQYYFAVTDSPPGIDSHTRSCVQFVPGTKQLALSEIQCGLFLANYIPRLSEQDMAFYQNDDIMKWLAGELKEDKEQTLRMGMPKSFAHICADSIQQDREGKAKGTPLLAVLKADVDRMGMLFAKGLKDTNASLSYYISLSRQLDLFFRGIVPNMFLTPPAEYPGFRNIYIVYTGGDDLLVVGPWRTILKFASYLQSQFRRYVCDHPNITLSAGISVCHSRFPLAQAAEEAEAALGRAKETRDRVCIFNTPLSWPDLEKALGDSIFLDGIIQEGGSDGIKANKGFVYRLIRYCQMADKPSLLRNLLWRSHLKYDMVRNIKILDKTEAKPPGMLRLEQITALTRDPNEMSRLKVAVTCCLYSNRGGE
jgi:CRISPR-associated protein Csm1